MHLLSLGRPTPGKRELVSQALAKSGFASAILRHRRRVGTSWLTVLTYHRTGTGLPLELLDTGVVAATAEALDRQLAFLKRHFDIVRVDDVMAALSGAPLPPSPLLVTFDDGYRDNYDVALPLLVRHGIPAVFFIATSYIEERRLFWWDAIHTIVRSSLRERASLSYPYPIELPLAQGERESTIETLLRLVKTHIGLHLRRFLDELAIAAEVDLYAFESGLAKNHLMTWDHVRALSTAGMDVQSHTWTHRVLQTLPDPDLAEELVRSRDMLRNVLGITPRALAYPVGTAPEYDGRIRAALRGAGYVAAFSNRGGVNKTHAIDALDIKRIAVEARTTPAHFESVMAIPALDWPDV
jgi:peptidoglycan/xylan/chitin deacetylase (PgdA/CDA1 family)